MSEKKRELTPQVPGTPEPAPVESVVEAAAAPVVVEPAPVEAPAHPVKASKKGFDENGIAHAAKGRTPEPQEVDPRIIKRAILTTQGYVVPVK